MLCSGTQPSINRGPFPRRPKTRRAPSRATSCSRDPPNRDHTHSAITSSEILMDEATRIRAIAAALHAAYGSSRLGNPFDPVEDLVFVCLARMTQERKYRATYKALRHALPSWDQVADAPIAKLEKLFAYAGLARTK